MAMYDSHLPYEEKECNSRIIREIAEDMSLNISQVEHITKHFSEFISGTIHSGSLEGVMVPYLGKFQVKLHSQQYKDFLHSLGKDMKKYFKSNKDAMDVLMEGIEQ
jgi:nucleoid DNA-binding protein